jgi:hypothetical protein
MPSKKMSRLSTRISKGTALGSSRRACLSSFALSLSVAPEGYIVVGLDRGYIVVGLDRGYIVVGLDRGYIVVGFLDRHRAQRVI